MKPSVYKSDIQEIIEAHREAGAVPIEVLARLIRKPAPERPRDAADDQLFVLRLYDGYEHRWFDETKPVPWDEALRSWNEKTMEGMERAGFEDGQYFDIFPADTRMIINPD